jgi:hypothetical protein
MFHQIIIRLRNVVNPGFNFYQILIFFPSPGTFLKKNLNRNFKQIISLKNQHFQKIVVIQFLFTSCPIQPKTPSLIQGHSQCPGALSLVTKIKHHPKLKDLVSRRPKNIVTLT